MVQLSFRKGTQLQAPSLTYPFNASAQGGQGRSDLASQTESKCSARKPQLQQLQPVRALAKPRNSTRSSGPAYFAQQLQSVDTPNATALVRGRRSCAPPQLRSVDSAVCQLRSVDADAATSLARGPGSAALVHGLRHCRGPPPCLRNSSGPWTQTLR